MIRIVEYFDRELGWTYLRSCKTAGEVMALYRWMREDDPTIDLRQRFA